MKPRLWIALLSFPSLTLAQEPVEYAISLTDVHRHEAPRRFDVVELTAVSPPVRLTASAGRDSHPFAFVSERAMAEIVR